jgi:putative two-component system response regulator
MRVLVVEDEEISAELLKHSLQHFGYEVDVARDGNEGYRLVRTGRYSMVISDWDMPGMHGDELCRKVRAGLRSSYVYFVLLTSHGDMDHIVAGLQAGADDFLVKPFRPDELRVRLRTGERLLSLQSRDVMLFTLAKLTESRDNETGLHLERVREFSRILTEELSTWDEFRDEIDGDYVQLIYLTTPLHDIGKVGVPDSVLLKPGKLTPEEFDIMKQHTILGGQTLAAVAEAHPTEKYLAMARDIALTHHERFDGTGYPYGLAGKDIPLCGRITALADVYDALTTRRVYKGKFSHEKARGIILEGCGSHFDPDIVQAFVNREQDFLRVASLLDATHTPRTVLGIPAINPGPVPMTVDG